MQKQQQVIDLTQKGHSIYQIQNILQQEWGRHSLKHTCIYKYRSLTKLGDDEAVDSRGGIQMEDEDLNAQIFKILEKDPYASSRFIPEKLNIW